MARSAEFHVGVDEAGLGPNLGPLVIVATRWSGLPRTTDDLWDTLSAAITQVADGIRLHIGDSKAVYKTKADFPSLERSARGLLAAAGVLDCGLANLVRRVDPYADLTEVPWLHGIDDRPDGEPDDILATLVGELGGGLEIAAAFVSAKRFNCYLDQCDSKGQALSRLSLETLRRIWSPEDASTSVWCDKHGGRNRYDDLLLEHSDGAFVVRHEEGRAASRYSIGDSEIVFGVKSEKHFPVACASIVAKYLRQRAMRAFNAWWAERVPGVKPTEGYPQDAKRFRLAVERERVALGISDDVFWRRK